MDARSELLAYLGSTLITIAGLFGLQHWYASYLDAHVVNVPRADAPQSEELEEQREQERAKLQGGKLPIDKAKAVLAQGGRARLPLIAPKPSDDLSAMSGWMHRPDFAPYAPRQPSSALQPAAPGGEAEAEAAATAEGVAEQETGEAEGAAAKAAVAEGKAP